MVKVNLLFDNSNKGKREMTKTANRPKNKKKKSIWSIPGLEKRIQALILSGVLRQKNGCEDVVKTINAEFSEQLAAAELHLTPFAFKIRLNKFVWTKRVESDLWRFQRNNMMDKFRTMYSHIPENMVQKREKELKGFTKSEPAIQFKAGMGRLSADNLPLDAGKYEFPHITFKEPFVISDASEGQMPIINGALVGIKYPDIERNTLRRALSDARKRGAKAVVLTNLIELWAKKTAGFLAVYRAGVSGIRINPERFPIDYRQEVQDILDGKITDKMIYQTLNERFEEIIDGLHKITHRKKGKEPEFPGSVYVLLGLKEEECINAATYYESRYLTIVEQNKIEAELNAASARLEEEKAKETGDFGEIERWNEEVARLGRKKARTIFTNHAGYQYELIRRRMRAYVVKRLEETIPGCKVLAQGSTYLKITDKIIKLEIPASNRVTDSHLADLGDKYGADVFRDTLADITIGCPVYALNHRMVGREDSKDGQPVTKYLVVAPSCLDGEFLREEFKDDSKFAHPVQELVFNPQFEPGVLMITWNNGIISTDSMPIEKLDHFETAKNSNFAYPYPQTRYINFFLNSDNHYGSPSRRELWDPKQRIHLGCSEAAIEMMRRSGIVNPADIGIHSVAEMDDMTNGDMWFKPRYRPDPWRLMVTHYEKWLRQMTDDIQRAIEKGDSELAKKLVDEVNQVSMSQMYLRGEDFPFHQMMQALERHIDPNVDFYSAVLQSFVRAKLEIRGISKINRILYDTRDLGVINFPEGNHRINTLEQAELEGDYAALSLQKQLAQEPFWQKYLKQNPEFLKAMVCAPRFGNITFGWGTVRAPGGYEWGVCVHASPARQSGWSDILAAVIKSFLARGDDTYGLLKHKTIMFFGDKHFAAKAQTPFIDFFMSPAAVHTDIYGSSGGFPPNNTGVCFVSIPADGPDAGPTLMRVLPHDYLRDWFANPKPFDWKKFLPKPV